ncbi:MAG TPA: hypothetical protein PK205_07180 [Promineifilum sp.]|nr:hypothetical protein [Promineifilum sp.]
MTDARHAVPTVTIVTANGPVNINESDFDPAKHQLWDAEQATLPLPPPVAPVVPVAPPVAPVAPAPAAKLNLAVLPAGKNKFLVVNADDGKPFVAEGIAEHYANEPDAWAAILAVQTAK